MAQGDVVLFDRFKLDLGTETHQLATDVFKLGLIDSVVTPLASTADPRWGAGGGTNLATNEVTPGGNYAAGGPTIANSSYTLDAAIATFDGDPVVILQDAANPTDARWGIIYNDTAAGKQAVGFVDLGGVTDLSAGEFSVTWNVDGVFTLASAA